MTLKEKIMKLQTYKMFEGEDTLYIERDDVLKLLEQEPCEMTAEKYRQRMIQAFHNADTDELIAVCVLPTEKEFEHLEWLLKNHYKQEPCEDSISRQAVLEIIRFEDEWLLDAKSHNADTEIAFSGMRSKVNDLPPVKPKFTDEEIQKMQDLEQAQIQKAYELGMAEVKGVEDCISRSEAIDYFGDDYEYTGKEIQTALKRLPAAQTERKGHWIEDEEQKHVEKTWHCSECGNQAWGEYEKTTYCCHCGARMEEKE